MIFQPATNRTAASILLGDGPIVQADKSETTTIVAEFYISIVGKAFKCDLNSLISTGEQSGEENRGKRSELFDLLQQTSTTSFIRHRNTNVLNEEYQSTLSLTPKSLEIPLSHYDTLSKVSK